MTKSNNCSVRSTVLTEHHLPELLGFFQRNVDRIDDISVFMWAEDPELFYDHWLPIAKGHTDCVVRVLAHEHRVVGVIESSSDGNGSRIGYMIDLEFEGQGLMYDHLGPLLNQIPHPVEARILNTNVRSQRLVERLNFIQDTNSLRDEHYIWRLI